MLVLPPVPRPVAIESARRDRFTSTTMSLSVPATYPPSFASRLAREYRVGSQL